MPHEREDRLTEEPKSLCHVIKFCRGYKHSRIYKALGKLKDLLVFVCPVFQLRKYSIYLNNILYPKTNNMERLSVGDPTPPSLGILYLPIHACR